ncbi:hypothetical protein AAFC00_001540 [Neodothiora populina]|uniref:Major facilitator superfamily (MFS) profile domain-containing protein n=1 Tax=Neodothiora populina TaxID=2781224 RepID=A0ABR3PP94_9PEZI
MYKFSNIYVLAAFGTIGGALFGFDVSSMSAWIDTPQYLEFFNHPDSNTQGGITASMSGGSFLGALAAGFLSDRFGRRGALMAASLVWVVGAAIQCSSQNIAQLIVGRLISGLSVGVTSSQVCVYLAELAPSRIRGRIVGVQQWAIEWGMLIMYLICYGCTFVEGPSAFRIAWGIQGVPGFILFGALFFFPESPRWLGAKERWEECLDTLALLHGNGDTTDPVVQAEYLEVREAARIAQESKNVSFFGLFGPKIWKRTLCGTSVQMWQQLLGGNVAMYYIVYVFQMAGLSGNVTLYSAVIQYVIFLVTTGVMLPFIDRIGRRQLLIFGALACCVCHFAIAGTMASYGHYVDSVDGNANLRWALPEGSSASTGVIAVSYIFVGIYGLTWAPTGWVYASEVFPLKYRAKGVGLSAATNWIFNFALAYFVAPSFTNIQWRTYIIFGVFCFAMTFHIFFMYPETQGKTLEEIDILFDADIKPWKSNAVKSSFGAKVETVAAKESAFGEHIEGGPAADEKEKEQVIFREDV